MLTFSTGKEKINLGTYAMKRAAAAAHLPTLYLFEPAIRPNDRADYRLSRSYLTPGANTRYSFLYLSGLGRGMGGGQL